MASESAARHPDATSLTPASWAAESEARGAPHPRHKAIVDVAQAAMEARCDDMPRYWTAHPGCEVHAAVERSEHEVGEPPHIDGPAVQ
jgi:hypothetical protein